MRKILAILGAITLLALLAGLGYWIYQSRSAVDLPDDFVYQRQHPEVIKAVLDPGTRDLTILLTDEVDNIQALGANTVYVYVDYSYQDGQFLYTQLGGAETDQAGIEQEHIQNIQLAKQQGFAVHLTLAFGGGQNTSFGVPLEKLLADIGAADLKWAAIGEQYQVETYAPSSEIDFQIFREYYGADWNNRADFAKAVQISNEYHDDVLPKVREVFSGKVIYQAGLWSSESGSKGYDIFGIGVNSVGREVSNFRELVVEIFGFAQINAKRQGGDWMVTELWIPVYERSPSGPGRGPALKTSSGVLYPEIQDDLYRIVFEEYQKITGQKPVGLGFTAYLGSTSGVKNTPAEAVIADFFNSQ